MRTSAKLVLTALMAAVVLASAVGTASARSLSTSEQSFRVSWLSLELSSSVLTVRCRITLEGSFHARTIAKVARSLIGAITRAIVAHACTGGEAWFDNGTEAEPLGTAPNRLPFHLTYESFAGTLPSISAIGFLLSRVSLVTQANSLGVETRCRYGRLEDNISLTGTRDAAGDLTSLGPVNERNRVSLVEGLLNASFCPTTRALTGTSTSVANLTTGNTITITLI